MSDLRTTKRSTAKYREYWLNARARHPEKLRARVATNDAVRYGKLVRQSCEQCGEVKTEAHHEDYSKPLEVIWLCVKCHHFRHRKSHCLRGHEFTIENTVIKANGNRQCRACQRTFKLHARIRRRLARQNGASQ